MMNLCMRQQRPFATQTRRGGKVRCVSCHARSRPNEPITFNAIRAQLPKIAAACTAAVVLSTSFTPAVHADIQTVAPSQLTSMAKPLPKAAVNKSRVWTLFLGGAGLLFAGTVAAENNGAWFPAISRANQAMAENRKAEQQQKNKM